MRLIGVFLLFLCTSFSSSAQIDANKLDQHLAQVVENWDIPGMTVGVVQNGQLVYSKGFGVKEVGKNEKVDGNTLYAIASNSKAFTSAILGMLVDEGKLDWNTKVQDVLPYFQVYDPYVSSQVTIRDILSHRVGLGTFSGDIMWYNTEMNSEQIIKKARHVEKAFDFRDGYGYSNIMYVTAGEIIRVMTGKSYAQNVQERILNPLGMTRTIAKLDDLDRVGNYASPHRLVNGQNDPTKWANWEEIAATGGLISSVNDMSKWMIANMNHFVNGTDTLLSASSRNMIWTPHNNFVVNHTRENDYGRNFSSYGLGWGISDYHGNLRVGHTGGYDGFLTAFNMLPDKKSGVIVLTNSHRTPMMAVSYHILDLLAGVEPKDYSNNFLNNFYQRQEGDDRIRNIKANRVFGSLPLNDISQCAGEYKSDLFGSIYVKQINNQLVIEFENSPTLTADLRHWHYNTYELAWREEHAWFSFDFFFEEINADKVN